MVPRSPPGGRKKKPVPLDKRPPWNNDFVEPKKDVENIPYEANMPPKDEKWYRCRQCNEKFPESKFKEHQQKTQTPCELLRCRDCDAVFFRADKAKHFESCPGAGAKKEEAKPRVGVGAGAGGAARPGPKPAPKAAAPSKPAARQAPKPLAERKDPPGGGGDGPSGRGKVDLMKTINSQPVYVGDRVKIKVSGRKGKVMYVGPADFAAGDVVVGIELDEKRTSSDCDGKYQGERYFRCKPWHGIYALYDDVEVLEDEKPGFDEQPELPREDLDLDEELDKIVGLESVKKELRSIRNSVEVQKKREQFGIKDDRLLHMLFLGNPGTGKTMFARLVCRLLHSLGVLKKGHLVEVSRKDLVGSYSGETASLTSKTVQKAEGGVLFIDEAHTLKNEGSSDSHGMECINTLVKELEDMGSKIVVILAGYRKEMTSFLQTNPGLQSRFPNTFDFPDFTNEDMAHLLKAQVVEKGFQLDKSLNDEKVVNVIRSSVKMSEASKGNGRLVRTLVEAAIRRQTDRVFGEGTVSRNTLTTLKEADFFDPSMDEDKTPQEVLAQLDKVTGLDKVKTFVRSLQAQLLVNKERKEQGIQVQGDGTLHMVFSGNPGTGKTTIARVVADLLRSLHVLRRGHLVEADRSALVAGYSGQTALKTKAVVESALGGVLFIDEAYALVSNERDQFGSEALDTLIKMIEDYRDDLVVILAGYKDEMGELMSRNPGVRSRFPTVIDFDDYSADELMEIATNMTSAEQMVLTDDAKKALMEQFTELAKSHSKENGNGRAVRNIIELAKRKQALRLAGKDGKKTKEELMELVVEDFQ